MSLNVSPSAVNTNPSMDDEGYIVISSGSEAEADKASKSEDLNHVPTPPRIVSPRIKHTPRRQPGSSSFENNGFSTQNKKAQEIDYIVETLAKQLECQKRTKTKVGRHKRKEILLLKNSHQKSKVQEDHRAAITGLKERKCVRDGLRRMIPQVHLYQAGTAYLNKRKRTDSSGSSASSDEESSKSAAIRYLLDDKKKKQPSVEVKSKTFRGTSKLHHEKLSKISKATSNDELTPCSDSDSQSDREKHEGVLSIEALERKKRNLAKVTAGRLKLDDLCLSCGSTEDINDKHPLFEGGLCADHKTMFQEWFFKYDQDGCQCYCAVCCMGRDVVVCDNNDCGRCFCSDCLNLMVGPDHYNQVASNHKWACYFCVECSSAGDARLLWKRSNWQDTLQQLFVDGNQRSKYAISPIPAPLSPKQRRPIRVLSLFDGIATGLVALKELGLQIEKYVCSEINENAIRLVQNHHPEAVHLGDVTQLSDSDVRRYGPFDLVMGGSPCNDLSGANPRRRGLLDPEGSGCLFFDFYRVLRAAEPPSPAKGCHCDVKNKPRPFFWLFENVVSMKLIERHRISRFLQCEPVVANARCVSAAARPRLFWGNIPGLRQLRLNPTASDKLTVQSCLEPGRTALVEKLNTITTKPSCLYANSASGSKAAVQHQGKDDVLWTTEVERIFGVPQHYTDVNNLGPRERLGLLGRSWSVPVIRQILAPLKEYFTSKSFNNADDRRQHKK